MKNKIKMAMIKMNLKLLWSFSFVILSVIGLKSQSSLNVQLISQLPFDQSPVDIWGYVDSLGSEYALLTLDSGFSVVDVSTPSNPVEKFRINGVKSTWRDVKSWDHFAYVVHDWPSSNNVFPLEGLLIVDLDSLINPHYKRIRLGVPINGGYDTLTRAHNLYIDENGVCYVFGSNVGSGGALMFDVATDPWNPTFLGNYNDFYFHDGMARGDTLWGAAFYTGHFFAIDVSNKASPVAMGSKSTPNNGTHNCWISDDNKTLFTTDEILGAYIASYDVSDFNNISELDRIQRLPGSNVIPHNTHVYGDFLVTSYYTTGVHITDAEYPDNLVEMGYYDTYPQNNAANYNGNWGAYPYLPSGLILASDRSNGLFILSADYKRASRFSGVVTDSVTGNTLINANIVIQSSSDTIYSKLDGTFIYGREPEGWDTLFVSRLGYQSLKIPINFQAGLNQYLEIKMLPNGFSIDEFGAMERIVIYPNPTEESFRVKWNDIDLGKPVRLEIMDASGRIISTQEGNANSQTLWNSPDVPGSYLIRISLDDRQYSSKLFTF